MQTTRLYILIFQISQELHRSFEIAGQFFSVKMSSWLRHCQNFQILYKRAGGFVLVKISVEYLCFVDENKTLFSTTNTTPRPCC